MNILDIGSMNGKVILKIAVQVHFPPEDQINYFFFSQSMNLNFVPCYGIACNEFSLKYCGTISTVYWFHT